MTSRADVTGPVNLTRNMRPLELLVERNLFGDTYTMGRFYVDGMPFGDTIEPCSLHLSNSMPLEEIKAKKVYGKTAIPMGRYKLSLEVSPSLKGRSYAKKYGGKFPYLVDVPCWNSVMIHPFNRGSESRGCISVAEYLSPGVVKNATKGYQDLMDFYLVPAFERGQDVYITISER